MILRTLLVTSLAVMPFSARAQEANSHKRAAAIRTADAVVTTYVSALAQCESTMKQGFGGLWIMHRDIAIASLRELHQDSDAGLQHYDRIYQSQNEGQIEGKTENSISDLSECPEVLEETMHEVATSQAKLRATQH
jgi:hypothetical protein